MEDPIVVVPGASNNWTGKPPTMRGTVSCSSHRSGRLPVRVSVNQHDSITRGKCLEAETHERVRRGPFVSAETSRKVCTKGLDVSSLKTGTVFSSRRTSTTTPKVEVV